MNAWRCSTLWVRDHRVSRSLPPAQFWSFAGACLLFGVALASYSNSKNLCLWVRFWRWRVSWHWGYPHVWHTNRSEWLRCGSTLGARSCLARRFYPSTRMRLGLPLAVRCIPRPGIAPTVFWSWTAVLLRQRCLSLPTPGGCRLPVRGPSPLCIRQPLWRSACRSSPLRG